ncbi:MAG: putative molybdenum carrier protein [Methylomicrobium sp.]
MNSIKIVSGGQTGVDRAALDAALETGADCGGWCPDGRLAEDSTIPLHYPVTELKGAGYRERTLQNVIDSDGTTIIYFGAPAGGTEQTLRFCLELKKPFILIDAAEITPERAAKRMVAFVASQSIAVLNVAGPRASEEASAYGYAYQAVMRFLGARKPL